MVYWVFVGRLLGLLKVVSLYSVREKVAVLF